MIESKYLKENNENVMKLLEIDHLKNVDPKSLMCLLRQSKIRKYEDGEAVINEGDRDPWLFFLISGSVKVVREGQLIYTVDKKGEIFGEMSLIDRSPRSVSILADGIAACLAVDTASSNRLPPDRDEEADRKELQLVLHRIFSKVLTNRLRARTDDLSHIKMKNKKLKAEILRLKKLLEAPYRSS